MEFNAMTGSIITATAAIFAAFIGGFFAKRYEHRLEARSIRHAIAAELRAVLAVSERRGYVEVLTNMAANLPAVWDGGPLRPFIVHVRRDYNRVFSAVANKIGMLPAQTAEQVVAAYYHIEILLEDFELSSAAAANDPGAIWIIQDYETFRTFNLECAALANETRSLVRDAINLLDPPPS